ncbi:MAG: MFS transporter [Prevotella sp.]|nr:MFS transporter [Prevotella sp.]MCM1075239.1 MFS transporter [Ruminococcus sp.]
MAKTKYVMQWLPTLYVAEALPYVVINTLTVLIYTRLNVDLETMTFWTGLLYLPWVIKPFWSPFVDIFASKRAWVLWMQMSMGLCFAATAILLPTTVFFFATLILFFITAFLSATHDIAADGYYMLELSEHQQAEYVGLRSTFYRLGTLFGSGALVWIAGYIEEKSAGHESITRPDTVNAWTAVLWIVALLLSAIAVYHIYFLPKAAEDKKRATAGITEICRKFGQTFTTFFLKPGIVQALLFMLLYRLPEALCIKVTAPFLVTERAEGGLELSTKAVGIANGITGVVALLAGGILGGFAISKGGLKKWLWPMALSLTLPCALYWILAVCQPNTDFWGLFMINTAIFVEQFGYGFGFTAFMLYLIYFSEGEWKTSHYAFCTGFMALGMMLPGMFAGHLFNTIADLNIFPAAGIGNADTPQGYINFFALVVLCSIFTCIACLLVKIDPQFGKKNTHLELV